MSLKRKASVSDLSSNKTPKKGRRSLEDTQPKVYGFGGAQKDEYVSEVDPMEGVDQPRIAEETLRLGVVNSTMRPREELARLLALYDGEPDDKAKRWTELVFIVFAKENFKQDHSGPPGWSTTTGPLTNAQLRDAYCAQFDKEVGAEAAMKRYRNDKQKVYNAFHEHPRTITYAPRQRKAKQHRSKEKKPDIFEEVSVDDFAASDLNKFDAHEGVGDESNLEHILEHTEEAGKQQNPVPTHVLVEHRRSVEANDMRRYVEDSWGIGEDKHKPWVSIRLADSFHRLMGAASVPTEHLRTSRAYLELCMHTNVREIWLTGVSRLTLQRYIQCLSPVRLWKLPQFDFALRFREYHPAMAGSSCKRVVWNFEATLDLYELASQLRDCHVRNLVLEHWRAQLQANDTYEVGLVEMQLLYDRLTIDDPALQFWTQALQDLLTSHEARMDVDLVDSDSATSFFVTNKHKDKGDDAFHSQYHRCRHLDQKNEKCHYSQNHHTEALYSLDDFNAIAVRLLLSEGWPEQDEHVQSAAIVLKKEFFNKYSSLYDGTAAVQD
ncbi:uncharacterized protein N0V89_000882 [Didymosphaeria variabile]|uniref:Uncharacterized protein n=1 Tax=Didymosphaeria variabile TaxID=1932322 RepID=A0A9W9CGA1_9PLEO|nr:uncharacterized protein N0V89_000882 [Didymosphaeria variabile]KAJ4360321.1 hypothetical protein N0V89_000882 [Didymosphaeria variabile]